MCDPGRRRGGAVDVWDGRGCGGRKTTSGLGSCPGFALTVPSEPRFCLPSAGGGVNHLQLLPTLWLYVLSFERNYFFRNARSWPTLMRQPEQVPREPSPVGLGCSLSTSHSQQRSIQWPSSTEVQRGQRTMHVTFAQTGSEPMPPVLTQLII